MIDLSHEWQHTPDEGDPLECKTWARLVWRVGGTTLTRAYDRRARAERDGIYIPLYPLARWALNHWWSLLYQTWPGEDPPSPETIRTADTADWIRAHCARAGLPGYAFPFACIFSRGRDVAVVTHADPHDRHTHTTVEFTENVNLRVAREEITDSLAGLVTSVLARLDQLGDSDERTEALRSDWTALTHASAAEREFCRAAGRLGLDPYDTSNWPEHVLEWFERAQPGELERAFAVDLLDSPDKPSTKPKRFADLCAIIDRHALTGASEVLQAYMALAVPHDEGYEVARWIRDRLGLPPEAPLLDLPSASKAASSHPLQIHTDPVFPRGHVLAAVGWAQDPIVIARPSPREEKLRFLGGRALYLALNGAADGPRLVTDARTADQRASRAFSAELLAPQEGIARMYEVESADLGHDDALAKIADHYRVSSMVIEHQLDNFHHR